MQFYQLTFCLLTINGAISPTLPDFGNAKTTDKLCCFAFLPSGRSSWFVK